MAMIECPKCGRHISSMAKHCPECGAPVELEPVEEETPVEAEAPIEEEAPVEDVLTEEEAPVEEETPVEEVPLEVELSTEEETPQPVVESAPQPKKEKGGGATWFLILALLLALLIGGLYLYDYIQQRQRERHAYELLQDCSNPDRFEDFIARFPKSKHIDEVRTRLQEVSRQQDEWLHLIAGGSRDELMKFVKKHPTSPYVKVAQTRIDSLDWAEADSVHTLEAVSHYVATHPDGYFLDEAEALRQTIERKQAEAAAARRDSLAARADSIV